MFRNKVQLNNFDHLEERPLSLIDGLLEEQEIN
jgi:hypothetical protein